MDCVRIYVRDITQRKSAETQLRAAHDELEQKVRERTKELTEANRQLSMQIAQQKRAEKYLRSHSMLLGFFSKTGSSREYAEAIAMLVKGLSGCRCVGVRLVDSSGKNCDAYVGFSEGFLKSDSGPFISKAHSVYIKAQMEQPAGRESAFMTSTGSFHVADAAAVPDIFPDGQSSEQDGRWIKNGFVSLAIIPVRHKDRIVATIYLADESAGTVSRETVRFVESLSLLIGEGINKFNLEERIRKDHAFLNSFFNHSMTPLVFLDRDFNFIRVNNAYCFNRKCDITDLIGRNFFEMFPHPQARSIFRQVLESKQPFVAQAWPFVFPERFGSRTYYWDWSLMPILDREAQVDFLVFSLVDVSERKAAEDKLFVAQKGLNDAKRLSDIGTLAATVAHELRNPLAAIQMAAYNIKRKAQDGSLESHFLTIENKVHESEQIISNLLFYSRLRPPQFEPVSIYRIIRECIDFAGSRHAKEKAKLAVNIQAIFSATCIADPLQIREVFSNILNNAYEAGSGTDKIISIDAQYDGKHISVTVRDNGEGIAKSDLERIFDPFFTTKTKGTGLGLTVCRQVVNFHGGSIEVESRKDTGTAVLVRLPVRRGGNDK